MFLNFFTRLFGGFQTTQEKNSPEIDQLGSVSDIPKVNIKKPSDVEEITEAESVLPSSIKQKIVFDGFTPSKGTNLEQDKLHMQSAFNEAFSHSRYSPHITEAGKITIIENGTMFVMSVVFDGSLDESLKFQSHVDRTFKKYGLRSW